MAVEVAVSVLAHQGGWDEILFVLAPLAILAALLLMARRRLDDLDHDEPDRAPVEAGGSDGPGTT